MSLKTTAMAVKKVFRLSAYVGKLAVKNVLVSLKIKSSKKDLKSNGSNKK